MAYNPLAFGQMLVAMGSLVFAMYLLAIYRGKIDQKQERGFGGVFILLGIVASAFGLGMFMNEPIPGHYIEVYGVGYLVFTLVMLIGGLTLIFSWDTRPASYLAFVGGLALLNSAYTIWKYEMSRNPAVTGALFLIASIGSVGSVWMTHGEKHRHWILLGVILFAAFGVFALVSGMSAQTGHVASAVASG